MRLLLSVIFLSGVFSLFSCGKDDDTPPTGRIFGQVLHHDDPILGATVYIKYNATEFPGMLPEDYDEQVTASEVDATYEFTELGKGSYYLYSIGDDLDCPCEVFGGIPVVLQSDSEIRETNIPVTE